MKRFVLVTLILSVVLLIGAQDYIAPLWELPEIYTKVSLSYLKYNKEVKFEVIENDMEAKYYHMFTSPTSLQQSICEYLTGREDYKSLLKYTTKKAYIDFNVAGYIDYRAVEKNAFYFTGYGMEIKANINNRFLLHTDWWKGHYSGATDAAVNDYIVDSWHKSDEGENNVTHIDNIKGSLSYLTDNAIFTIGRGNFLVGNNISGSIILDNNCDDYGYLSAKLTMGDFSYSVMQGTLIPDEYDGNYGKTMVDKFVSLHKIDWNYQNIHLFLGEEIIYGHRSLDSNYLLPLGFWRINEHLLRDRDNVLIFAGGDIKLSKTTLYSNLILDELSKDKIFTNWWGNKWAFQAGLSQDFHYLLKDDITLTGELTIVRPWLYTHKYYWNYSSHSNQTLGYPEGTNLVNYSLECNIPIERMGSLDLNYSLTRQGDYANSYLWNYEDNIPGDRDEFETELLEGEITNTTELTAVYSIEWFAHHYFKLAASTKFDSNDKKENTFSISYMTKF